MSDTKDSNGAILEDGDTVYVVKDLKIKGSKNVVKRGTTFKNISLTNRSDEIDVRNKQIKDLVLKTQFVKKV